MKVAIARTLTLALALSSTALWAQNLVQAPDFDNAAISPPWSPNGGGTATFDPTRNAAGAAGSGSLSVVNTVADGFTTSASQCINQPLPSGQYDFGGWMLFPAGSGSSAAVAVSLFLGSGCSGSSLGFQNAFTLATPGWTLHTAVMTVPVNVLSALVDVRVDTAAGVMPPVQAWFDGVRFGPRPTTPVELESFSVD